MMTYSLMSPSALSKSIREKKKKMMKSEPEMIGTSPNPDMNAQDIYDAEKAGQIEDTIDSPKKINADETALDHPYEQKAMSKEPMESHVNPKDHGRMAYGGMAYEESHSEPMMPSLEHEEMIGGSSGGESESHRMLGNKPSVGSGEGQSEILGSGMESEEARRIKMRKMRLNSYLDGLDI